MREITIPEIPPGFRVKVGNYWKDNSGNREVAVAIYEVHDGVEYGLAIYFPNKIAAFAAIDKMREDIEKFA